jgi:ubiquinone/menaquinone biosynthesis C-methylase UbiE
MARRQHVPWKAAGAASEERHSADEVVRETGWVFNNVVGSRLTLAEFVSTGDHETGAYLQAFDLAELATAEHTLVEIGAGIGRMTAGFTRMFGRVYACDLDAAFLERCRETVAQYGVAERLITRHVADGRTLPVDDGVADLTFSYITLQHCQGEDAVALVREAVRVTRPGGAIALNLRTWVGRDVLLWPLGKMMRAMWRVPGVGPWLARRRLATRLGWQANRLAPSDVLPAISGLSEITIFRSPRRIPFDIDSVGDRTFDGINQSHWWLVARVAAG